MVEIEFFPYLEDNFALLIHNPETKQTLLVDAGPDVATIETKLLERNWHLDEILVTHHHWDHIDGVANLKDKFNAKVTAPDHEAIDFADIIVTGREEFDAIGLNFKVISTPGHTMDQVAYYCESAKLLASADALFSLGCGRMFEGTPAVFWDSLSELRELPDDTMLYCGHEYTLANGKFALTIDPENVDLIERMKEVEALREQGKMTLPVSLEIEKKTNPFLRVDDGDIRASLDMTVASNAEVFGQLRKLKDQFKG